jgi:hypothetical protein
MLVRMVIQKPSKELLQRMLCSQNPGWAMLLAHKSWYGHKGDVPESSTTQTWQLNNWTTTHLMSCMRPKHHYTLSLHLQPAPPRAV